MPQVPYTGAPSIGAENNPTPSRQLDVPIQAFGAGTAQAVQNLGRVVAGAGDEIFGRALAMQQLAETASANAAVADYTMQMGELYAQYKSYEGKKAVDEYQPFIESINQLREKVKGSLGSEFAQKAYDSETRMMFSRTVFSAAAHAGDENKKYVIGTAYSRAKADANYASMNPEDDEAFNAAVKRNEETARIAAQSKGLGEDAVKNEALVLNTGTATSRITSMLNRDPTKAQTMLETYRKQGLLDGDTADKLQNQIDTRIQTKFATAEGSKIFNAPENKDASFESLEKQAEEQAQKQFPDNPMYKDRLVNTVRTLRAQRIAGQRQDQNDRNNRMFAELNGLESKDGKLPTSVEDLSPDARSDFENSDKRSQATYLNALTRNAANDFRKTPENQRLYFELRGAMLDPTATPAEREAAVNRIQPDMKMPLNQMKELYDIRNKLWRGTLNTNLISKGMSVMNPILAPLGITSQDKNKFNAYKGAFDVLLTEAQVEKKAPLTSEDIRAIGMKLLSDRPSDTFWGGVFGSNIKEFETQVPAADRDQIVDIFTRNGRPVPDDATISRLFWQKKARSMQNEFQQMFGKSTNRVKQ